MIGCASTKPRPGPAWRGLSARLEAQTVLVGRVDDGTARRVYGNLDGYRSRIEYGATFGSLPGEQDVDLLKVNRESNDVRRVEPTAAPLALRVVYDSHADDVPRLGASPKERARTHEVNERKGATPWLCAYGESMIVPTDEDNVMHVVHELLGTARVRFLEVSNGGFCQVKGGAWEYRKTRGERRLTRGMLRAADKAPRADEYQRPDTQVRKRQNFNRNPELWAKARNDRATFSAG